VKLNDFVAGNEACFNSEEEGGSNRFQKPGLGQPTSTTADFTRDVV
jgi:hypothetical protein